MYPTDLVIILKRIKITTPNFFLHDAEDRQLITSFTCQWTVEGIFSIIRGALLVWDLVNFCRETFVSLSELHYVKCGSGTGTATSLNSKETFLTTYFPHESTPRHVIHHLSLAKDGTYR